MGLPRLLAVGVLLAPQAASAGVEAWRVNEVGASLGGDDNVRFVELYAPPSAMEDNCFYPSTLIEILDAGGGVLGSVVPFSTTRCFPGDTYIVFATPSAETAFGIDADAPLNTPVPAAGGQVCVRSSATRYDCTRFGAITMAVPDFFNPGDATAAPAIPDGQALARVANTHVVEDDFVIQSPTPRQPNDGTIWLPPDAGPPPDASPDATIYDAWVYFDAPPLPRIDARPGDPNWFVADPGGGAVCQVAAGRRGAPGGALLAAAFAVALAAGARWSRHRLRNQ